MDTDPTLDALTAFQVRMNAMPSARAKLIADARDAGHSWPTIGRALGMSHVGAMKAGNVMLSGPDLVEQIAQQLRERGNAERWTEDHEQKEEWRKAARAAARKLKRRVHTLVNSDSVVAILED